MGEAENRIKEGKLIELSTFLQCWYVLCSGGQSLSVYASQWIQPTFEFECSTTTGISVFRECQEKADLEIETITTLDNATVIKSNRRRWWWWW